MCACATIVPTRCIGQASGKGGLNFLYLFFTNRESYKGVQLLANGRVALTSAAEDDGYFATRVRHARAKASSAPGPHSRAGPHRLHDRFEYSRDGTDWFIQRLNP